jgi:hypothetical protein
MAKGGTVWKQNNWGWKRDINVIVTPFRGSVAPAVCGYWTEIWFAFCINCRKSVPFNSKIMIYTPTQKNRGKRSTLCRHGFELRISLLGSENAIHWNVALVVVWREINDQRPYLLDITPCSPFKFSRSFGRAFRIHLQGRIISRKRNQPENVWQIGP